MEEATEAAASVVAVGAEGRQLLGHDVAIVQLAEAILLLAAQVADGRANATPRRRGTLVGLLLDSRLEVAPLAVQLVAEDGQEALERIGHFGQGGGGRTARVADPGEGSEGLAFRSEGTSLGVLGFAATVVRERPASLAKRLKEKAVGAGTFSLALAGTATLSSSPPSPLSHVVKRR